MDIVAGACALVVEEDEFRQATRHHDHDALFGVFATVAYLVPFGEAHGNAQCTSTGDNGNLVEGVAVLAKQRHQSVTGFVVGRVSLFFVGHQQRAAFGTHAQLVAGFFEVQHGHFLVIEACSQQGGFVHQIF